MKTYSPKPEHIERRWYVVDASDQVLGRLASEVAALLRGKHKPIFAPHMDTGDHVIVINADKVVLTGGKELKKVAYRHSGYPGGITGDAVRRALADAPGVRGGEGHQGHAAQEPSRARDDRASSTWWRAPSTPTRRRSRSPTPSASRRCGRDCPSRRPRAGPAPRGAEARPSRPGREAASPPRSRPPRSPRPRRPRRQEGRPPRSRRPRSRPAKKTTAKKSTRQEVHRQEADGHRAATDETTEE